MPIKNDKNITYQSPWINLKEGIECFDSSESFLNALTEGKIRATGCFLDERHAHERSFRNNIDSALWENFNLNKESNELEYEDPVENILIWITDIKVSRNDIEKIRISNNKAPHSQHTTVIGGAPKLIKTEQFYTEMAALFYTEKNIKIPDLGNTEQAKKWREELYQKLPCLNPIDNNISDRTVRRYISEFLEYFHNAVKKMDSMAEENVTQKRQ